MNEIDVYTKPTGVRALEIYRDRVLQDSVCYETILDKNISHHIHLLLESVNRAIYNLNNPNPNQKQDEKNDINSKIKKYIAMFKANFEKLTNVPLLQKPNGTTIRQIQNVIYTLQENDADVETYMKFLFEDFFTNPKNATFLPPQIGFTISNFAIERFLVDYKEVLEKKKANALKSSEMNDILNRYRVLIRKNTDNPDVIKTLKDALDNYKNTGIDIKQFKEVIISLEK